MASLLRGVCKPLRIILIRKGAKRSTNLDLAFREPEIALTITNLAQLIELAKRAAAEGQKSVASRVLCLALQIPSEKVFYLSRALHERRQMSVSRRKLTALSPDAFFGGHDGFPTGTRPIAPRPLPNRRTPLHPVTRGKPLHG
jgi:hypothetical protein